mmetsp:Transcript_39872/g.73561  ORF Transcript_39872/g.73561 Transcript_39872/m.73561 type:complete len:211 (-) Transcript_39872:74-706(-)
MQHSPRARKRLKRDRINSSVRNIHPILPDCGHSLDITATFSRCYPYQSKPANMRRVVNIAGCRTLERPKSFGMLCRNKSESSTPLDGSEGAVESEHGATDRNPARPTKKLSRRCNSDPIPAHLYDNTDLPRTTQELGKKDVVDDAPSRVHFREESITLADLGNLAVKDKRCSSILYGLRFLGNSAIDDSALFDISDASMDGIKLLSTNDA